MGSEAGLEQYTASRSSLTEVGARTGGAAPSMDAAASRFITAVPDGSQVVPTVVAFLKFTKDLVVSRRRFVALLLSIGGAFAWANSRVSSRERLKVRSSESVGETQLVWSCSRTDCSSRSLPLTHRVAYACPAVGHVASASQAAGDSARR